MTRAAPDRADARVAAHFLAAAGTPIAIASGSLALAAIVAAPAAAGGWLRWLVVLLGVPALYYAVRVRFDATLFADLARSAPDDGEASAALATLDASLVTVVGRAEHSTPTPRSLGLRIRGARRLVAMQAIVLLAQVVLVLCALLPVDG